jgi:hypothetical protein
MAVGKPERATQNRVINLFQHEGEQAIMAKILSDMEAEMGTLEGKLAIARHVRQGMMSVLLAPPGAAGQAGRARLV